MTPVNANPIAVYTDHEALKHIFASGKTEKGRVATWLDVLGEFDLIVYHRPNRDQHIGIADGLSRMPTRLMDDTSVYVKERMWAEESMFPTAMFLS